MKEYIDRVEYCEKHCQFSNEYCNRQSCPIWKAPVADVTPVVHGRWKYYPKQNKAVCTCCSFERDLDENFGSAISCPNCGVKMDVGDTNEAG